MERGPAHRPGDRQLRLRPARLSRGGGEGGGWTGGKATFYLWPYRNSFRLRASSESARDNERVGIGIVGSGFMGHSHTFAFNAVAGIFDLPLVPRLEMLADANEALAAQGGEEPRLCPLHRRLAGAGRRPCRRPGRHHHAERPAQADRPCRARPRQAGLLRKAARAERRRRKGDGRRRREGRIRPWSASPT